MTLIAVARNKFVAGLKNAKNRPARHAYEVLPLEEALRRTWSTDAHCVTYVVGDPARAARSKQPRLTKLSVQDESVVAYTTCFFADVDNPDHGPWTPELRAEWDARWSSTPMLETAGAYLTAHGARIVQPLSTPVPIREVEPHLYQYLTRLREAGFAADMSCKDWTRHFRMPFVVRDGEPTTSTLYSI